MTSFRLPHPTTEGCGPRNDQKLAAPSETPVWPITERAHHRMGIREVAGMATRGTTTTSAGSAMTGDQLKHLHRQQPPGGPLTIADTSYSSMLMR